MNLPGQLCRVVFLSDIPVISNFKVVGCQTCLFQFQGGWLSDLSFPNCLGWWFIRHIPIFSSFMAFVCQTSSLDFTFLGWWLFVRYHPYLFPYLGWLFVRYHPCLFPYLGWLSDTTLVFFIFRVVVCQTLPRLFHFYGVYLSDITSVFSIFTVVVCQTPPLSFLYLQWWFVRYHPCLFHI